MFFGVCHRRFGLTYIAETKILPGLALEGLLFRNRVVVTLKIYISEYILFFVDVGDETTYAFITGFILLIDTCTLQDLGEGFSDFLL